MKALITGITGMIGSHFARACRERGWETLGIARNTSASRLFDDTSRDIARCDIIDKGGLVRVFERTQFDMRASAGPNSMSP
ncbi:MAG: NAD-dependent epimerase/dehydratase family protein [Nitrospira sp.]|nr:NAD-dependent epimerase/dehydratase family protein [Nitrospira sp.]